MLDVLLDALLDTLMLAPLLLAVHVLIEVFEYHAASKIKMNKVLTGRLAPLIGSAVGVIPQCGFSVVAANLYAKRHIRLGTLLAVFIATSDEAVPILLSDPGSAVKLLPLLGFKLLFAVGAGYLVNALTRRTAVVAITAEEVTVPHGCHGHEIGEHVHDAHTHRAQPTAAELEDAAELIGKNAADPDASLILRPDSVFPKNGCGADTVGEAENGCGADPLGKPGREYGPESASEEPERACETDAEPQVKKKFDWSCFVVHPLVHTLTVLGFILAVNLVLGTVLYFVGEAQLAAFMNSAKFFQPFLSALVGLIPNCASSVVITQLYASGTLTLGAAFAGLSVNAGLGLAVLFKENRNLRENLGIVLGLYAGSCALGVLLSLLPL